MPSFLNRVQDLPALGIGVSTEYGASSLPDSLDVLALRDAYPEFSGFLEVGVEAAKGLDETTQQWRQRGLPMTYHFLDVNLDEDEDFDAPWLASVAELAHSIQPAWMCGDAGLWHFGKRERGHMLLLPPILSDASARAQAEGVSRLRDHLGYEVFPENPPGQVYLGNLHILEFYARVATLADTGLLLDCAHLAIYQRLMNHSPLTGLDAFPLESVVELHVAGSAERQSDGFTYWEDNHTPEVLADTWEIFEWVIDKTPNLTAIVFECERNPQESVIDGFKRIAAAGLSSALVLPQTGATPK